MTTSSNSLASVFDVEIIAFMPTPFANGGIDVEAVRAQMQHYRATGITVGIMGGMGEYYSLSFSESELLIRTSVAAIGPEGRVIAAIGYSTREAVELAKVAGEAGCVSLVINPPYYVQPSPTAFADHVRAVTEAAGLEAVVYSCRLFEVDDSYVEELVKVPLFRGVKDEVSTHGEFRARVQRWGDRVDFWAVGEHSCPDYLQAGARAVTSALASVCPEASREHVAGTDTTGELTGLIARSIELIGAEPGVSASVPKIMIDSVRDWPTEVRSPQADASPELNGQIRGLMKQIIARYR